MNMNNKYIEQAAVTFNLQRSRPQDDNSKIIMLRISQEIPIACGVGYGKMHTKELSSEFRRKLYICIYYVHLLTDIHFFTIFHTLHPFRMCKSAASTCTQKKKNSL